MKKTHIALVLMIIGVGGYIAYRVIGSRPLSPPRTATHSYNGLDLKVVYCSPSKRGRMIFGDSAAGALVPNGKFWRLGANESTEVTFSKDVMVANKPLKAGSYRMYAVPNQLSWLISFNSELGTWGYNEPDYSKDVLKLEIPAEKVSAVKEQFAISFTNNAAGVVMNVDWDQTHVALPITLQ